MPIQTTYTTARANLAKLCDEVTENNRIVIISRRGRHDVAMIAADELSGLLETLHLLRSPKNAERLFTALERAKSRKLRPKAITTLRKEVGLGKKEVGPSVPAESSSLRSSNQSSLRIFAFG